MDSDPLRKCLRKEKCMRSFRTAGGSGYHMLCRAATFPTRQTHPFLAKPPRILLIPDKRHWFTKRMWQRERGQAPQGQGKGQGKEHRARMDSDPLRKCLRKEKCMRSFQTAAESGYHMLCRAATFPTRHRCPCLAEPPRILLILNKRHWFTKQM